MGSTVEATNPASVITMAITLAKIGRSMKKREKLPMCVPAQRGVFEDAGGGGFLSPGAAADGPPAGACCGAAPGASGWTGAPGRSFIRLSTMTDSPAFRPPVTTQFAPIQLAVFTGRIFALPSGPATHTRRSCSCLLYTSD